MTGITSNIMQLLFNPSLSYIWGIVTAAIAGSFINMLISRYPQTLETGNSLLAFSSPASHCDHCRTKLRVWHLIPIISYLALKGRCSFCNKTISKLNICTELIAVCLAIISIWCIGYYSPACLIFIFICIALSIIDFQHKLLPDFLTLGGMWLGIILSALGYGITLQAAVLGAAGLYILSASIAVLYKLIRKRDGLGLGDCKLLAMLGAWLGFMNATHALLIAVCIALAYSATLLLRKQMRVNDVISFGPFLAMGGVIMLLWQLKI